MAGSPLPAKSNAAGAPSRPARPLTPHILDDVLTGGLDSTARVYRAIVVSSYVVALAHGGIWPPEGGSGLSRNLPLLAVVLPPGMLS